MKRLVSFRRMQDGTREDYLLLDEAERRYAEGLGERVLEGLRKLDHSLEGYPVSRLGHSLQAATRALRDGADEELIVAALIHDIGDELAPYNHCEIAAAILRPYVRAEVTWIVAQHGLFQNYYYVHHLGGDRHARERLRDHPWYEASRSRPSSRSCDASSPAHHTIRAISRAPEGSSPPRPYCGRAGTSQRQSRTSGMSSP